MEIKFGTTIHVGNDSLERLNQFKNEKILIVTDEFISNSEIIEKVKGHIDESNEIEVYDGVIPDPPIDNIIEGMTYMSDFEPTQLIALGGGSAMDAAKGIVFFAKQTISDRKIPFIVIPTTSGTGSEVTNFSIITDADKGVKYPLITDEILPDEAILDVDLVKDLPKAQTANTGIDVLTHAIEAYVSTKANDFSDALAEKAIKDVFEYLPRAYKDGSDMEAREKMHNASCLAGLAFNQASLGLNHGIAHAAGAKLHIPHGRLNGILLPHVIRYNSGLTGRLNKDVAERYRKIAALLGLNAVSSTIGTRNLINEITKLLKKVDLPASFSEYGTERSVFDEEKASIAEGSLQDKSTDTNPIKPTVEGVLQLLNQAY